MLQNYQKLRAQEKPIYLDTYLQDNIFSLKHFKNGQRGKNGLSKW